MTTINLSNKLNRSPAKHGTKREPVSNPVLAQLRHVICGDALEAAGIAANLFYKCIVTGGLTQRQLALADRLYRASDER